MGGGSTAPQLLTSVLDEVNRSLAALLMENNQQYPPMEIRQQLNNHLLLDHTNMIEVERQTGNQINSRALTNSLSHV
jgi:hypothetical protein